MNTIDVLIDVKDKNLCSSLSYIAEKVATQVTTHRSESLISTKKYLKENKKHNFIILELDETSPEVDKFIAGIS